MPAGEQLIAHVQGLLSPAEGKNMDEIRKAVTLPGSPRAVRYAVKALIDDGKAVRKGRLIFSIDPANAEAA